MNESFPELEPDFKPEPESERKPKSGSEGASYRIGRIEFVPGVLPGHVLSFFVAAFLSIGLMTFINVGQTYVLNEHLGVPESAQGGISGNLVFLTEIVTLLCFLPAGILIDRIGRRSIYAVGFLLLGLTYILYPLAQSVEALFFFRAIYGLGVVAVAGALSTVLVDYPAEVSRGKVVALIGVLSGLGIVLINQGFGAVPEVLVARGYTGEQAGLLTHLMVAVLCLLAAGLVMLGLKPGIPILREERPSVGELFRGGFAAARNPRVALAYGSAFIARGDQSVNAIFLILWGTHAGTAAGMDAAEAVKNGTLIFVIAQISAMFWAPILGPLMDRIDRVSALALCMVLAAIGNLSLLLLDDPLSRYGLIFYILLGIGQISVFLGGQSLIGQEAPREKRGSVLGAFNISGAIGIMLITLAGGYLYDQIDPRAPFVLVGAVNVLLFFACLGVRLRLGPQLARS